VKTKKVNSREKRTNAWTSPIFIWAIACASIAVGLVLAGRALKRLPMLELQTVEISGLKRTRRETVIEAAGLFEGINLLRIDLIAVKKAAESLPWIESAETARQFPSTILLEVKEREPSFLIRLDKELFYLTSGGNVIRTPLDQGLDFPVVTGMTAAEVEGEGDKRKAFLSLTSVLARDGLGSELSEIHMDPTDGLIVYTAETGGTGVRFGFSNFLQRMEKLKKLKRHLEKRNRSAYAIDLTYGDRIIARLTPEEEKGGRQ